MNSVGISSTQRMCASLHVRDLHCSDFDILWGVTRAQPSGTEELLYTRCVPPTGQEPLASQGAIRFDLVFTGKLCWSVVDLLINYNKKKSFRLKEVPAS